MTIIVKYKNLLNTPVQYDMAQKRPSTAKRSRQGRTGWDLQGNCS